MEVTEGALLHTIKNLYHLFLLCFNLRVNWKHRGVLKHLACSVYMCLHMFACMWNTSNHSFVRLWVNALVTTNIMADNEEIAVEFNIQKKAPQSAFLPTRQWSNIPSQWGWPPDLLPFALVTALCHYSLNHVRNSFHHINTRAQSTSLTGQPEQNPTQITFPAVTDLQPSDRTAHQRTTASLHNRDKSPLPLSPHLWIGKVAHRAAASLNCMEYLPLCFFSFSYCPDTETLRLTLQGEIKMRH